MATITNQATLTYNGVVTSSNIAVGELLEALSATKTAVNPDYTVGETVTYVVSVRNSSAASFPDLTVTDNLGGYLYNGDTVYPLTFVPDSVLYFLNGAPQATPTVTETVPLTIEGIDVPANANALLVYAARVNSFAPQQAGGTITNTATVSGQGITPISAQETVDAAQAANLSISKAMSPTAVTANSELTYTFTIYNDGNTAVTVEDDAAVTDAFPVPLSDLAVVFNGTAWTELTDYTYDTDTGAFATVPGRITVPAATYTQDPVTGSWTVNPGISTLTVTGTV